MSHFYKTLFLLFFPFLLIAQTEIYKQIALNTSNPEILTQLSNIVNSKNYYRLKTKKEDDTIDYSSVQVIVIDIDKPIDIQFINTKTLQISTNENTSFSYAIFNTMGQVIISKKLDNFVGIKTLDLGQLPKGIYFVQTVLDGNEGGQTKRFFAGE